MRLAPILMTVALQAQTFPEWRPLQDGMPVVPTWQQASILVVGKLRDVQMAGVQRAAKVSPYLNRGKTDVYWCRGELEVTHFVRGEGAPGRYPFLWGTVQDNCELQRPESSVEIRLWMAREEKGQWRLVRDGAPFFLELGVRDWTLLCPMSNAALGRLALRPDAYVEGLPALEREFHSLVLVACSLLRSVECRSELRGLWQREPTVRVDVCRFFDYWYHERCPASGGGL